jgi:hypothetical protein
MNGCEHGVWEMGGYHILWWWAFQNGEVEHYAVLHQEESGLEILNHDEEYLDERENETKFNEAPEAGHELLRLLAPQLGYRIKYWGSFVSKKFSQTEVRRHCQLAIFTKSKSALQAFLSQILQFPCSFKRDLDNAMPDTQISRVSGIPNDGARGG